MFNSSKVIAIVKVMTHTNAHACGRRDRQDKNNMPPIFDSGGIKMKSIDI